MLGGGGRGAAENSRDGGDAPPMQKKRRRRGRRDRAPYFGRDYRTFGRSSFRNPIERASARQVSAFSSVSGRAVWGVVGGWDFVEVVGGRVAVCVGVWGGVSGKDIHQ